MTRKAAEFDVELPPLMHLTDREVRRDLIANAISDDSSDRHGLYLYIYHTTYSIPMKVDAD